VRRPRGSPVEVTAGRRVADDRTGARSPASAHPHAVCAALGHSPPPRSQANRVFLQQRPGRPQTGQARHHSANIRRPSPGGPLPGITGSPRQSKGPRSRWRRRRSRQQRRFRAASEGTQRCAAAPVRMRIVLSYLGRGLISAEPKADRSKLDEGEVIGGELVIAGGDTPALLDLIEEPLDHVARP
jgi:hypothetical protein